MGYKKDQNCFAESPPPLPPRQKTYAEPPSPFREPNSNYHSQPLTYSWSAQDPRTSSTQSLVPEQHSLDNKRTLLLVYIHGFMGNETSFQSFPAHVHNFVTVNLADTHHVHTKIYPRYKSRKAIEHARDDFSRWLCPHESPSTDVILLGHSMGGILSAEVALLDWPNLQNTGKVPRHRIVGTINFDTPFLGMHPGVVVSGIGSIFRPAPSTAGESTSGAGVEEMRLRPGSDGAMVSPLATSQRTFVTQPPSSNSSTTLLQTESRTSSTGPTSPFTSPTNDPNYNPPFPNDVRMATRTGWGNALHFINKHSDGLARATKSYVTSYFEFGGCLADYNGLKNRYSRLRSLEETDSRRRDSRPRVRYVNYYTASTGRRPKKPKSLVEAQVPGSANDKVYDKHEEGSLPEPEMDRLTVSESNGEVTHASCSASIEENRNGEVDESLHHNDNELLDGPTRRSISDEGIISESVQPMIVVDAAPISDDEQPEAAVENYSWAVTDSNLAFEHGAELGGMESKTNSVSVPGPGLGTCASTTCSLSNSLSLPPIPAQPQQPAPFDASIYSEKDARRLAEKEHSRQIKAYERALKDRDSAIRDRSKLLEKREKTMGLAREKQLKLEGKEIARSKKKEALQEAEASKIVKSTDHKASSGSLENFEPNGAADEDTRPEKSKRDKKFCMLPPKSNGEVDPCWVRVYMRGVDEVGAHCGLFLVGEQYEWLVRNVGERIQDWVNHL